MTYLKVICFLRDYCHALMAGFSATFSICYLAFDVPDSDLLIYSAFAVVSFLFFLVFQSELIDPPYTKEWQWRD